MNQLQLKQDNRSIPYQSLREESFVKPSGKPAGTAEREGNQLLSTRPYSPHPKQPKSAIIRSNPSQAGVSPPGLPRVFRARRSASTNPHRPPSGARDEVDNLLATRAWQEAAARTRGVDIGNESSEGDRWSCRRKRARRQKTPRRW